MSQILLVIIHILLFLLLSFPRSQSRVLVKLSMQRRSTKKSRHGCKECKRRHVKCDESRPSCANCNVRHSQCSFLSTLPLPRRAALSPGPSPPLLTALEPRQKDEVLQPIQPTVAQPLICDNASFDLPSPSLYNGPGFAVSSVFPADQTFKLYHLELLHNFQSGVLRDSFLSLAAAESYIAMTVGEAVQVPFLMDQVLAISAANMSIKRPHQQRFYQEEATRLQTRGLTLFNAAQAFDASGQTLAYFVFATLLSNQVLFDACATRSDFPTFLDRLAASLRICGGVRSITGDSWSFIKEEYRRLAGINLIRESVDGSGSKTTLTAKLAQLEVRLADSHPSPSIWQPCSAALAFLKAVSCVPEGPRNSVYQTTRVIQWAVQVPEDFITLVEERRPEALIITAYFALLIHESRGHWIYGDAGAFIIRSITKFLGRHWADWLAWPNEVIDSGDWGCVDTDISYAQLPPYVEPVST
ncbi:hypothetical protein F4777DRAFT_572846 [Nemania sp. FL0916]|nr:hypothetical protein F4777DRAFT_572846 [Nemania sp. FL0916]